MKFLLYLTLGYTEIEICASAVKDLLNFANKNGITLLTLSIQGEIALFRVYTHAENRVLEYFQQCGICAKVNKRKGVPVLWKTYRYRAGLLTGMVLFILLLQIAPLFLWQINITGLDRLNSEYVMDLLRDAGVRVGAFSPSIDRDEVYANVLYASDDISWISVNIRGSSANVEIVERKLTPTAEVMADGANIVAAKDGQVIDAKITRGRRIAENGTVVQAGALLVSGVYDTVKMGTRFVYADAVVLAKVNDVYAIEIPLSNTKREYGEEQTLEMSLKMFGKSINIFKNYSQETENYDTINRKNPLPIADLDKLPLFLETVVALPFSEVPVTLTESEALERAERALQMQIVEADYSDLLFMEETYTVENDVLYYNCRVEAIQNIAAVSEFSID